MNYESREQRPDSELSVREEVEIPVPESNPGRRKQEHYRRIDVRKCDREDQGPVEDATEVLCLHGLVPKNPLDLSPNPRSPSTQESWRDGEGRTETTVTRLKGGRPKGG